MIYPTLLTGFGRLVFFTHLSLMEFPVKNLVFFLLFSVIDGFEWFSMVGSRHKNIQLMLELLKAPFMLMTFLMRLSVMLLDHPDEVICDAAIYANDTTLYSKCDQASDL